MTMGVSNLATVSMLTTIMQNNQSQIDNLGEEVASGQASQSLAGYGTQAGQVLDLNSSLAAANAYVSSANNVSTVLNGYDSALTELENDATQLSQGLSGLSDSGSSTSTASLAALVNGLQVDVGTTLNTQIGNQYIFSGTRYETPPVQSLTTLPAPTSAAAFTPVASPALPDYDTAAPGSDAAAWAQPTVTIAPGETLGYGISSTDPAIQQLVYALQNAAAAASSSDPASSQYLSLAQNAAQQALTGLQTLQAQNGANITQVNTAQSAQQQSVTTLTGLLGGIENVNMTQVSTQITSMQNLMDASYKVTDVLLNLSLASVLNTGTTA